MSVTLKQTEQPPANYPATPSGTPTSLNTMQTNSLWRRVESYTAYRWSARSVEWIIEGCGEWTPPLTPATIATTEVWQNDAWVAVELSPSPLGGYVLPGHGPYRFTATVGPAPSPVPVLPSNVLEAYRRLATYWAAKAGTPGVSRERIRAGSIDIERTRSESWMAAALQNSGAADLLRTFRKV